MPYLALLLTAATATAAGDHPERWYQERWCGERGGETEVVLEDKKEPS